jgi:hypothetical protein
VFFGAVMKKTTVTLPLFLALALSIVATVEVVEVVEANPFFMFDYIEPIPDAIPPDITVYSPENSTRYSSDIITVSLNVSKPQQTGWTSSVIEVTYSVDDSAPIQIYCYMWPNEGSGTPEFNTNFSLNFLSAGKHSLKIEAVAAVRNFNTWEIFWIRNTSTTFFTVKTEPFRSLIASMTFFTVIGASFLAYSKNRKN